MKLSERLRVPCGVTTGHGERCAVGWLCGKCEQAREAAAALDAAEKALSDIREWLMEPYGEADENDPLVNEAFRKALKSTRISLTLLRAPKGDDR